MQEVMKKVAEEYMEDKEAEQFMEGLYGVPTVSPLYVMENTTEVSEEEILSNEIYLYQRGTDQVTRIFGGEPER